MDAVPEANDRRVPSPVYARGRVREGACDRSNRLNDPQTPSLTLPRGTGRGDRRPFAYCAALLLCGVAGCAAKPDPIPRYTFDRPDTALTIIHTRLARFRSVRGEATMVLTDAKRQSIRLNAAFALRTPADVRLRAWKFGQAVFDLTLRDDEAWAYFPRDQAKPAAANLRRSLGEWLRLMTDNTLFASDVDAADFRHVFVQRRQPDGTSVRCMIDRATCTPREYTLFDADGVQRFTLTLSDYRSYADNQVWPTTIVARSEQGVFEIHGTDIEVNTDLPDALFKPPSRAEKLP